LWSQRRKAKTPRGQQKIRARKRRWAKTSIRRQLQTVANRARREEMVRLMMPVPVGAGVAVWSQGTHHHYHQQQQHYQQQQQHYQQQQQHYHQQRLQMLR
jgi:hypothetical protein